MNRRGFLGALLAAAAAPAIVRASSLMPVAPRIIVPPAQPIWMGMDFGYDDHMLDALRYGLGLVSLQVVRNAQGELTRLTRQRINPALLFHLKPDWFRKQ